MMTEQEMREKLEQIAKILRRDAAKMAADERRPEYRSGFRDGANLAITLLELAGLVEACD